MHMGTLSLLERYHARRIHNNFLPRIVYLLTCIYILDVVVKDTMPMEHTFLFSVVLFQAE
jgi:hypothetical protein